MSSTKDKATRKRPNLRTVAEHVALSPATVSLALRGDASIPAETRERILTAAVQLNYEYVPRVKKSDPVQIRRIAFVMRDFGDRPVTANPFYGDILSGTELSCREQHVSLNFVIVRHDHAISSMLPPVLTHDDVDGILLASPYPAALIRRISRESGCPIVLIDNVFPGCPHDSVMADDFGGAYQLVAHLIEHRHTQIAMLTGYAQSFPHVPSFQERYRGYLAACADGGVTALAPISVPVNVDAHPEVELEAMKKWVADLMRRKPQITAFFAVADRFALAFLAAVNDLGIEVPARLSVVGFDDVPQTCFTQPPLTTIHSFREQMAELALARLLARIDGDDLPPQHIKLGTELVVRESSGDARPVAQLL
jgi:LacI family transcriptional regulator